VLHRVKRRDRIARWVITAGGGLVIVSVLGILVLIVAKTLPLFLPASVRRLGEVAADDIPPGGRIVGLGVDLALDENGREKWAAAFAVREDGTLPLMDLRSGSAAGQVPWADRPTRTVRAVEEAGPGVLSLLWSDGSLSLVKVAAVSRGAPADGKLPPFSARTVADVPSVGSAAEWATARRLEDGSLVAAALFPGNRIVLNRQTVHKNMLDEEEWKTERRELTADVPGRITAVALDGQATALYAGTDRGNLLWWRFGPDGRVLAHDVAIAFRPQRAITSLAVMLGDVALVVGDAEGGVSNWFLVRSGDPPQEKLRLVRTLPPQAAAISRVAPAWRKRFVLVADAEGALSLDYTTTGCRLATLGSGDPLQLAALSPRADAAVALDRDGRLLAWRIDCPHPEISWQTLWGNVFYEGYDAPARVWQTTGGEEYEPKFSLVPLLFGTIKGTFYAMFFAVPLALGAAAYVSYFTTREFKAWIKPGIELMAAVPSVVIGFLVALWLGPRVERGLLALALSFCTVPAVALLFLAVWQFVRRSPRAERMSRGREFLLMAPLVAAGIALAVAVAAALEDRCFGGNLRLWLAQHLDIRYDQRNNILIAFGLGFAVIPIIFSLAEDALGGVPHNMTAASMALGASRWQTLWRVVLPSASPGIFAAVMIGFGRAVGETMIVLMATGNTPILDWSPLTGMRALSANIAVEFPEAPVDDTLYRVLFLCAVLLFAMTFVLNTAAELVRQRLRKRFGQF
jgi:phosphate transport system permease protein